MEGLDADNKRSARTSDSSHSTASDTASIPVDHVSSIAAVPCVRDCSSGLESLPPEIRRYILSCLDLPRMKVLVHASPTFHQQYVHDRKYLLCRSLEETLGSVTVDAYAVHLFAAQVRNKNRNISGFLRSYSESTAQRRLRLADKLTQDEVISMVAFYFHYVEPTTEHFVSWIIQKLRKAPEESLLGQPATTTLTNTELMRFTRATYRFQTLCHLGDSDDKNIRLWREDNMQAFLDILEPWEREELYSFYQFAEDIYHHIFDDIRWDLHPDNPKFDDQGRPPTPDGAFDLSISNRSNYLEGTVLRGLAMLHEVLFEIKHHEDLVATMQRHITSSYIPFNTLEGLLGETQQTIRRQEHPSERDRMQEERVPLPFRGDGEPNAPPLGWIMIWGGTYSNLYGWYTSDDMRQIGYVFWDAATLENVGGKNGKEVLKRLWEEFWDEDPRDMLF
ncbi:hypothetical protein CONLIGDRAFT_682435 [Coniochaeta ligniaria NRRL 30616]|uniref:F-box domain-containing protein n=1 Tax=Coniochaeta ligniaria NRRL 30616 TaxID=1408157 RepID=A0A1J7JDR2_9PEZI|nr:hypothetical protein CONLIGDRAFT_682435 [Coniochaeta ligniaria NRRL 30616]